MYNLPQEIEVWYIIPAIRKELSSILVKKYGFTLERAGEALGVSKAAVSQYLSKKRANSIVLPKELKKEIEKSAVSISKNEKNALKEILRILQVMKKKKCSCKVCRKYNPGIICKCKEVPC